MAEEGSRTKGVDTIHSVEEAADAALMLAKELDTALAITGPIDLVTDGERIYRVLNGHQLMGFVTGTGCTATALIAAFVSVDRDPVSAAATALAYFGLAGERGADTSKGPGTYQIALLDALFNLDEEALRRGVKIET